MDRSQQLFQAVDKFNEIHEDWAHDANSEHPTLAYWDAFDEMLSVFEGGDLPRECRPLATAVYRLAQERNVFDASGAQDPQQSFWSAREELAKQAQAVTAPGERKHLESIAELDRQKVPHEQIARIWGLKRPDGTGKAYLVQQELNQPGSVITPDYVHPDELKEHDELVAARKQYLSMASQSKASEEVRQEQESKPCPETPRELWLIGVSTQQASRMLKLPQAEVSRMWADFEAEKQSSPSASGQRNPPVTPQVAPAADLSPLGAELADPAEESAQASIDPLDEEDDFGEQDEDDEDPYSEFSEWSDDDVKSEAKRLGISIKGKFSRNRLLDKIIAAEQQDVADDQQAEQMHSEPEPVGASEEVQ